MVIVFEFTTDESEVKIGSRGNRPFRITVTGSGGHAAYPEQLSNPIEALLDVLSDLRELNHPEVGKVVVPTVLEGGDRTNVVPEEASSPLTFVTATRNSRRCRAEVMIRHLRRPASVSDLRGAAQCSVAQGR